jgi:hypothetical protein
MLQKYLLLVLQENIFVWMPKTSINMPTRAHGSKTFTLKMPCTSEITFHQKKKMRTFLSKAALHEIKMQTRFCIFSDGALQPFAVLSIFLHFTL